MDQLKVGDKIYLKGAEWSEYIVRGFTRGGDVIAESLLFHNLRTIARDELTKSKPEGEIDDQPAPDTSESG